MVVTVLSTSYYVQQYYDLSTITIISTLQMRKQTYRIKIRIA